MSHISHAMRAAASAREAISAPVFLTGAERSGTTLLRLMLDHHPDIAFNLESEFLVDDISPAGVFPDVETYRNRLKGNRVFRHSGFNIPEHLDFPGLVNDFLRQKLERDQKRVVGATVHYGFSKLRYLWPEAKYIYLLRDGRDVACSVVEMGWAGNAFVGANWWTEAENEWAEFRKSLPRERWIEVRYEDLIANAEAQLQRICALVGVPFSKRMFDYTNTSSYSLPDASQGFKWRRKISARDIRLLEARIGSQPAARGYELSCGTPSNVGPIRTGWMHLRSRLGVLTHKVKVFGFRLIVIELASRRFGWTKVHGKVQLAIDGILDRRLK